MATDMGEMLLDAVRMVARLFAAFTVVLMFAVFLTAFLSEQKSVVIHIDKYGEAVPELFMYLIIIPMVLVDALLSVAEFCSRRGGK